MNNSIPQSERALRAAYHEYVSKYGRPYAITAMATDYGCTDVTVRRHLDEAGIRIIRPKPERPAEDLLRQRVAAVTAEHGARAVSGKLSAEFGVTQTTIRKWMADYGMYERTPRRSHKLIEDPCPCGAIATTRYRGQEPPLCFKCYMRVRSAEAAKNGTYKRVSREHGVRLKEGKPCTDCGVVYPTYVTHWDHVPERGPKLFNIGAGDYSLEKTLAEIAKCDLVCANCHAVRTWNRWQESRMQGVAPAELLLPVAGDDAASAVPADVLF